MSGVVGLAIGAVIVLVYRQVTQRKAH
jgi:hypothetical protein